MVLMPEWQEVRASHVMRTTGDWSELVLELPGRRYEDSENLHVEAYLTSDSGQRIEELVTNVTEE